MRIDDRVATEVAVYAAKAAHRLAVLEALEGETPALSGTSHRRLHLARKLKGARSLAQSWARVAEMVAAETQVEPVLAEPDGLDKEFPS